MSNEEQIEENRRNIRMLQMQVGEIIKYLEETLSNNSSAIDSQNRSLDKLIESIDPDSYDEGMLEF